MMHVWNVMKWIPNLLSFFNIKCFASGKHFWQTCHRRNKNIFSKSFLSDWHAKMFLTQLSPIQSFCSFLNLLNFTYFKCIFFLHTWRLPTYPKCPVTTHHHRETSPHPRSTDLHRTPHTQAVYKFLTFSLTYYANILSFCPFYAN